MSRGVEWNPLFEGYYGRMNTGDDVFCTIAAWGAQRYWGSRHIRFASERLPIMPASVAAQKPQAILSGKPLVGGYAYSLLALIYRSLYLAGSSGIVYAGGSTLLDIPLAKQLLGSVAQVLNKPLTGIGLSIGPFKSARDRQRVAHFLGKFSFLTLRDRTSFQEAKSMVRPQASMLTFDLAGLLPAVYGLPGHPNRRAQNPLLGLALGHHGPYDQDKKKRIEETLVRLAQRENIDMRFCVFSGHPRCQDRELAQSLAARLRAVCPTEVVPYGDNPGQMWQRVAECDAFFAERLHSAIFAYMARVPFAMIEYHRKCADLAHDIGVPESCRISSAGPDPAVMAEVLASLLRHPLYPELSPQEAQARAELNFVEAPWCRGRNSG